MINNLKSVEVKNGQECTYVLYCPIDKKVRYVGCSSNPLGRYNTHLSSSKKGSNASINLSDWINILGIYRYKPKMKIVAIGNQEHTFIQICKEFNQIYNKPYSKDLDSIDPIAIYSDIFKKHYAYFSERRKTKIKL